jgi:hypothetical protein
MRFAATILAILIASSCDAASDPASLTERRLTPTAELRIGSLDDPESALSYVAAISVGPDGRIYSLHPQEERVRIHDAEGIPAGFIGREGEGPGEFGRPFAMGWLADALWVLDASSNRFSYFDTGGTPLRVQTVSVAPYTPANRNPPRPHGLLSDGTIFYAPSMRGPAVAAGLITETAVERLDLQATVIDTVYVRSLVNSTWHVQEPDEPDGIAWNGDQPLSDAELVLHSPSSSDIVRVRRTPAGTAGLDAFRVSRVTFAGDTLFSREYPYVARPIESALVDSLVQDFMDFVAEGAEESPEVWTPARAGELARASLYLPPTQPPVTELHIGHDGSIWLRREMTVGATRDWLVLSPEGEVVGTVALPANLKILAAEQGRLWGVETDELDVPYIVRYGVAHAEGDVP